MKKFLKILILSLAAVPATSHAQFSVQMKDLANKMNSHGVLNTLEIGANIGTTGLGLEVASPVTEWAKVRAGVDWMPPFTMPMNFELDSYVDGNVSNRFDRIQEFMHSFSGMEIDKNIKMESKPTMTVFRFLVDVYPFKNNRHWHITAGFFVGGKSIGTSRNTMTDMPSLLAMNIYNKMFADVMSGEIMESPFLESLGVEMDPEVYDIMKEKLTDYGELGVHVGDFKVIDEATGEEKLVPYLMRPDEDGTVSAKAKVNRFRPYVGFGYGGALSKDGKWQASFDAGVQFWGGAPKVTTHDGTVLNDLVNLRGKVGDYMDLMKGIPVYPTIDFRISYRF